MFGEIAQYFNPILLALVIVLATVLWQKRKSRDYETKHVPKIEEIKNSGIIAMQVYFPAGYVDIKELAQSRGIKCSEKGEEGCDEFEFRSFCGDNEDDVSMALSVTHKLLESHGVTPQQIGRLEVYGKQSGKCIEGLFEHVFDGDVEAVATTETSIGCVGSLISSLQWVDSHYSNGKYALVVASSDSEGDGSAAVAFLLGRDASLVIDLITRITTHRPPTLENDSFLDLLKKCFDKFYEFQACSSSKKNDNDSPSSSLLASSLLWVIQRNYSPGCDDLIAKMNSSSSLSSSSMMTTILCQLILWGYRRNPMSFKMKEDDPVFKAIAKCLTAKDAQTSNLELRNHSK